MAIGRITGQMLSANLARSGTDLTFETNLLALDVSNSRVGIGTASPATTLHVSATDSLRLPSGTTAQRPGSAANGDIRYNSTISTIEGYANGAWANLASGSEIKDADSDTSIDVELSSDIDEIHMKAGGTQIIKATDSLVEIGSATQISGTASTITGLVTNGNINITPNGTGEVVLPKVNIGDGEIDGTVIGANSAAAGTFTNLTANGTIDIDSSGNMDGIVIGANTAAAGTFTTVTTTGNAVIGGNLTVSGTTTTIDSQTLVIEDPLLTLAKNNSGGAANTFDQGLFFNRGSDSNVSFLWDESADEFVLATTASEDGTTAGNVTIDLYQQLHVGIMRAGTELRTGTIKADDGSASATIADSTGVMTIASSVLTTADINGGTADGVTIGGSTAAAGTFTTLETSQTIAVNADSQAIRIGAGNDLQLSHDGTNSIISNATGDLQITGVAGSEVVFNEAQANIDFRVESDGDSHALFVDASENHVGIRTSAPAYDLDAGSSTDAIRVPVGTTAQRPTAANGIIRFNSTTGKYEGCNDGSTFVEFAIAGDTPTFSKVSATGDGSTTTFTGFFGSAPENANNVFVYIDNVYQEPTENYTVSGTNITFTSAPHSAARIFAITGADNSALVTGGIVRTETSSVNFTSTATDIMSFNATSYRAAEAFIILTDTANTEYSVMKAVVVHNGTTAFGTVSSITNTGSTDLATITFEHDGSNTVSIKATSTGGQTAAKVQYSLAGV